MARNVGNGDDRRYGQMSSNIMKRAGELASCSPPARDNSSYTLGEGERWGEVGR